MAVCAQDAGKDELVGEHTPQHQPKRQRGQPGTPAAGAPGGGRGQAQHSQAADRQQQHRRDDGRGDGFRFAMTVGMIFVRRRCGHHEAAPDDDRTEQIGQRFDPVRDQRMGMPDEAGEHLHSCEQDIGDHSQERHAQATLETGR